MCRLSSPPLPGYSVLIVSNRGHARRDSAGLARAFYCLPAKRSWAGEVRNVSLLVAIGVKDEGYREILGICEGAKEDRAGWSGFPQASQGTRPARCPAHHFGRLYGIIRERGGVLPRRCVATLCGIISLAMLPEPRCARLRRCSRRSTMPGVRGRHSIMPAEYSNFAPSIVASGTDSNSDFARRAWWVPIPTARPVDYSR